MANPLDDAEAQRAREVLRDALSEDDPARYTADPRLGSISLALHGLISSWLRRARRSEDERRAARALVADDVAWMDEVSVVVPCRVVEHAFPAAFCLRRGLTDEQVAMLRHAREVLRELMTLAAQAAGLASFDPKPFALGIACHADWPRARVVRVGHGSPLPVVYLNLHAPFLLCHRPAEPVRWIHRCKNDEPSEYLGLGADTINLGFAQLMGVARGVKAVPPLAEILRTNRQHLLVPQPSTNLESPGFQRRVFNAYCIGSLLEPALELAGIAAEARGPVRESVLMLGHAFGVFARLDLRSVQASGAKARVLPAAREHAEAFDVDDEDFAVVGKQLDARVPAAVQERYAMRGGDRRGRPLDLDAMRERGQVAGSAASAGTKRRRSGAERHPESIAAERAAVAYAMEALRESGIAYDAGV